MAWGVRAYSSRLKALALRNSQYSRHRQRHVAEARASSRRSGRRVASGPSRCAPSPKTRIPNSSGSGCIRREGGRDPGELVGIGPIGVAATNDADELIALKPDCVVYAAMGPERDAAAVPDYVRLLEAGVNVVTTTVNRLIYPAGFSPTCGETQLEQAAEAGGASLYASGIEPGFAADHLVLMLATQSKSIRRITASEIALYDDYPVVETMTDAMGFGRPLDYRSCFATGPSLSNGAPGCADRPWARHGDRRDQREFRQGGHRPRFHVAFGTAKAGTCGAVRIQAIAVIGGREVIIIEHVNKLAPDLAPEWGEGAEQPVYRIRIEGEPISPAT